jgi:hypothetical protein
VSSNENTVICIDGKYKKIAIKTIYWKVIVESVVPIKRDREWFAKMTPILEKQWKDVVHYRDNIYCKEEEIPEPSETVCLF